MNILEKEHQIETLWKNYETWRTSQNIIERIKIFSQTAREIIFYEEYLERERQAEAQLLSIGYIWHIQDSIATIDATIKSIQSKKLPD